MKSPKPRKIQLTGAIIAGFDLTSDAMILRLTDGDGDSISIIKITAIGRGDGDDYENGIVISEMVETTEVVVKESSAPITLV